MKRLYQVRMGQHWLDIPFKKLRRGDAFRQWDEHEGEKLEVKSCTGNTHWVAMSDAYQICPPHGRWVVDIVAIQDGVEKKTILMDLSEEP